MGYARRVGRGAVIAILVCVACGGRTELGAPEQAPTDAGHETTPPMDCTVTLSVADVTTTSGCWIDERVSYRTALLRWACDAGAAEADFGVPFVGTVQEPSTYVSLSATTTFVWSDACTWQSEQRIEGALSSGALQYSYSEKPVQGTNCAPAYCTGSALVSVQ